MQILTKICKTCGKEFHNHSCQTSNSRTWINKTYCSIPCCNKQKILPKKVKKCLFCDKEFYLTNKSYDRKKYCSKKCQYKDFIKRYSGKNNPAWLGGNISYGSVHNTIRSIYGKAIFCEIDKTHKSKRYEWANLSGKYSTDRNDWKMMCQSCHRIYDLKFKKDKDINSIIANTEIKLTPTLKKLRE